MGAPPAPEGEALSDLHRRRDELAEQVTELHWDLGGLAYEMAIRDHFRLDVLVRRAALLQERDADLAELEDQLRRVQTLPAVPLPAVPPPAVPPPAAPRSGPARPSPWMAALLLLVFLGFGAMLGDISGSPAGQLAASVRPSLKLVLPPAVTAPLSSTASQPTAEPPPSSPEPAPASSESSPSPSEPSPAEPAATGTSKPASPKRPSGSSGRSPATSAPSGGSSGSPAGGSRSKLPPVKHVFVIMLADQPYAAVFGPSSPAPYLSQTLERRGELLVRYYAVAHEQLANEIALISGQGPTADTTTNCPTYTEIAPATVGADQQVLGNGCVYPAATQTLAGQLTAKHRTWRAYLQGMDEGGAQAPACGHPTLGQADPTAAAQPPAGQTYATFRNPFVYFDSVVDTSACAADDVGLNRLSGDLRSPRSTASFSYIVPDRCHDGSPAPCAAGAPAGLPASDGFLKQVVPEILRSQSYKDGGLLVITVDEAPSTGEFADSSSCCEQPRFPNLPAPAATSGPVLPPSGGGQIGALLLSPYVKPGTTDQEAYDSFSLLRTIEDLFGLGHLGYAAQSGAGAFETSVFSAYTAG